MDTVFFVLQVLNVGCMQSVKFRQLMARSRSPLVGCNLTAPALGRLGGLVVLYNVPEA